MILMVFRPGGTALIKPSWPAPSDGWPDTIAAVPYDYSAGPSASSPASWLDGANCQRFAYGVLSLFGIVCPALPSSDLWEESAATRETLAPEALDLILLNGTDDPYGAHVGVWMSDTEIFHLCREVGRPATWSLEDFARRPRYAHVIGFKRVTRNDVQ